ncbi:MAG TPA: pyruvate, water dikinase regulatory protein [Alphaproteobacteria bacterium]|nr:pyruvate, water dikinase regulatory protein [Alphaproteobacteria bacterium]
MKSAHIHLISDSTGETVNIITRACIFQFQGVEITDHMWPMVRNQSQLETALEGIAEAPGMVIYTLLDNGLRDRLEAFCQEQNLSCMAALEPFLTAFSRFLGIDSAGRAGGQHVLDAEYFDRIEAINYVMTHDDGQAASDFSEADVVLVGVSRTSKTPTCFYLANRGIKAANVPIVPGAPLPEALTATTGDSKNDTMIVALTEDPMRLVQIRRNRMRIMNQGDETAYTDIEEVKAEVAAARRLFTEQGWPTIDVTRRSIEETAAEIMQLMHQRERERAQ